MKFKSKKPKPPTGMEMTVTFMMPESQTVEERRNTLVEFLDVIPEISDAIGSVWLHLTCAGIPSELEDALQAAHVKFDKRPSLVLVVDNAASDGEMP